MAVSSRVAWTALAVGLALGPAAAAQPEAKPAPRSAAKPAPRSAAKPAPGLLERTDAIAREVSALRGLPLRAPIAKELVDRAELRRRLVEMMARPKEAAQLERDAQLVKHWGLVPPSLDYRALVLDVLTAQIAGYYDDETKRLTLTENPELDPEWSELVLVHEIQHALQDQSFALRKLREVPQGEDDAATARLALVEGDGLAVMLEVMAARSAQPPPWASAAAVSAVVESLSEATEPTDDLKDVPLAVREQLAFPYRAGFAFIAELRKHKPWRAVDAAFRKPPQSTEQILHPQLYLRGEARIAVPALALPASLVAALVAAPDAAGGGPAQATGGPAQATGSAGLAVVETVWGELGFSLFLRSHGVPASMAAAAAAGWGGDRVSVVSLGGGGELGAVRSRWDSERDAREAYDAVVLALDHWPVGALVERGEGRARWVALSGRVSAVERRGSALVITHGAQISRLAAIDAALWRGVASVSPSPAAPRSAAPPPVPSPASPAPPPAQPR